MLDHLHRTRYTLRRSERGQALVLLLVVLGLAAGMFVFSMVSNVSRTNADNNTNALVLAQAKEALIGYAASDSNRPGSLPCPDTDNDGGAESPFTSGTECPSYIGRLPWRTLGLSDLRDSSGERLWYAVTREFARNPSCQSTCPMNSDTKGTLNIVGTSLAGEIIAVVFAPGPIVPTQDRSLANRNAVAHYLEGGNETGIGTSIFVTGATTTSFNDRLLAITGADVMTPVEKRAAREILRLLADYKSGGGCDCYPWADNNWNGTSNNNTRYGGIPLVNASPNSWSSAAGYNPPAWLSTNKWYKVIYYAVSQRDSNTGHSDDPRFTVNSTSNVSVVLITTGPAVTSDGRPTSNWTNYVDDLENRNNDDTFMTPSSTAYARDRLYTIP
jgi:hypothetical protein